MINKVKILSPGTGCRKTKKLIKSMKDFFEENDIEAEFEIVSSLKSFLKYKTWMLPTVVINDKVIARGYRPDNKKIMENMK